MLHNGAIPRGDNRYALALLPSNETRQNLLTSMPHAVETKVPGTSDSRNFPQERIDPDICRLLAAGRQAEAEFNDRRKHRRKQLAGWLGLALLALVPALLIATMPERVVAVLPSAAALYQTVGSRVNVYGVEIRSVDVQNLLLDGQRVMSIKGEIVNVSPINRKIPWLRFGLRRTDGGEVYHWQLDTEARPLRPGETTSFTTRLAAPPETASRIEIRFAHADEIGSNTGP